MWIEKTIKQGEEWRLVMNKKFRSRSIWAIGLLLLLSACVADEKEPVIVEATGDKTVQELELSNFEQIGVSDMFKVEVFQGEEFKVVVELEETLIPYEEIVTRGKELRIGLKSGHRYQFQNAIPRVEVTLPELTRVEITGKSTVIIHDFEFSAELEFDLDDLSSLAGEIYADSIRVDIRGHSGVHLSGMADEVRGSVIGLSTLNLADFNAARVTVEADQLSEIRYYKPVSTIRPTPTPDD